MQLHNDTEIETVTTLAMARANLGAHPLAPPSRRRP